MAKGDLLAASLSKETPKVKVAGRYIGRRWPSPVKAAIHSYEHNPVHLSRQPHGSLLWEWACMWHVQVAGVSSL